MGKIIAVEKAKIGSIDINFYKVSDIISCVAPIGIFFGRIANFINGELYGKIKGNYFRSRNHIKLYLNENKLFENVKK